jgi:hypothetical protein
MITPDFGESDAVTLFSIKSLYSNQLAQWHIPLWTSKIGGGYPIFALGTMAPFFLPNLIFFRLFNTVVAYNLVLVFSLCFLGWGMYFWLRLMKYQRISCLFGALTTTLSGYCIVQLTHITIVQSYCLFPWLSAFTLQLSRKKSWMTVGWFMLALAQEIFLGFPQCVFITLLFLSAYWVWLIRNHVHIVQKTVVLIVAIIGGCLAAAVQILPSVEFLKTLATANGYSLGDATYFSYPFIHLVTLINPFALGNPTIGTYPPFSAFDGSIFWENTAYIGIIPLLSLATYIIVALWKKWKMKSTLFFTLVLGAAFLLMTGKYSPFSFVYVCWPFTLFRVPSRFIWLFTIALIMLCTHAFDWISKHIPKIAIVLLVIHIISLVIIWSPYHLLIPASDWLKNPPLSQRIDHTKNTISIGAEQLYSTIYTPHGWNNLPDVNRESLYLRNTLTPDKSMLWDVRQIGDYAGREIQRSQVFTDLLNQTITTDASNATISAVGKNILTLLSIKNVISALPLTQEGLTRQTRVFDGKHEIDLYQNPDAVPTIYFAKTAIQFQTTEDAVATMRSNTFIPGDDVLVEFDATPAATLTRGSIRITSSGEERYTASVTNPNANAILVLTQTYYPGWHASIDSREVPLFPVNIKHIGIIVPKGDHTIIFWYLPKSFIYGAWISGGTFCGILFFMLYSFLHI